MWLILDNFLSLVILSRFMENLYKKTVKIINGNIPEGKCEWCRGV